MVNKQLLEILVCPESGAPLSWDAERGELVCHVSRLAYPVVDGVPVMLVDRARRLEAE